MRLLFCVIIAMLYGTLSHISAKTFYVPEAKWELPAVEDMLRDFIIPFAQEQGYSPSTSTISIDFEFGAIMITYDRCIPTYSPYWEDVECPSDKSGRTGIYVLDGIPIRVGVRYRTQYVKKTNRVFKYSLDCGDCSPLLGTADCNDTWRFRYENGRLVLKSVTSFVNSGNRYEQSMIPPGFRLEPY